MKYASIIIAFIFIVVIVSTSIKKVNSQKEFDATLKQMERKYDSAIAVSNEQLRRLATERAASNRRIDSLSLCIQTLVDLDSIKSTELKRIKGRYNKFTNSELALEMEKRAK